MLKIKIIDCLKKIAGEAVEVEVFVPENDNFGHYSTNLALRLAKIQEKNPMEIAESIKNQVLSIKPEIFEKIEVAGPGFVNFWIKPEVFQKELKEILKKGDDYGAGLKKKEKISLDYLDANPTGPIHLGHARSGFLGDVVANVLEFSGYRVSREFYVNNAKTSVQIQSLGKTALGEGEEYKHSQLLGIIGKPAVKEKIKKINLSADKVKKAGSYIASLIQKENEKFLKQKAKIKFDLFFEEENVYSSGLIDEIKERLKKAGAVYEKDCAVWLKSKEKGDNEDRVLIRSNGEPTYLLPDVGYHWDRFINRKFDKAINIWGADHFGYGPRLKAALSFLGVDPEKVFIITTQIVRLIRKGEEVKMSKRTGEFITLEELIEEAGLDAVRFFFLMSSPETHMDFDLDLAKERSLKNPVYYAQYAFVRIQGIIEKLKNQPRCPKGSGLRPQASEKLKINLSLLNTPEDINLMRTLARFPEIIEEAAGKYNPQILVRYCLELARRFHNFYEKEKVAGELEDFRLARLELLKAVQIIFKNLFNLLGISLPRKM